MFEILKSEEDSPQVLFPPLVPVVALIVAVAMEWIWPLDFLPPVFTFSWALGLGLVIFVIGLWLAMSAMWRFRQAGTNIVPTRSAKAVVTDGPYRFTRNPMYLAFLLDVTSLSLVFSLEWGLILVPVMWFVIDRFIIPKEEAYLTKKFGADYQVLLDQTRRWI